MPLNKETKPNLIILFNTIRSFAYSQMVLQSNPNNSI